MSDISVGHIETETIWQETQQLHVRPFASCFFLAANFIGFPFHYKSVQEKKRHKSAWLSKSLLGLFHHPAKIMRGHRGHLDLTRSGHIHAVCASHGGEDSLSRQRISWERICCYAVRRTQIQVRCEERTNKFLKPCSTTPNTLRKLKQISYQSNLTAFVSSCVPQHIFQCGPWNQPQRHNRPWSYICGTWSLDIHRQPPEIGLHVADLKIHFQSIF